MSQLGLLCTIENGIATFQRDASETEKSGCFTIMKSNPVLAKHKHKTDWVKFKKSFVSKFQSEFGHVDLTDIMEAKMISNDLNPMVFGSILRGYIHQFFDESIHEAIQPGLKGYEYYYALDELNSRMDILEQINLVAKAERMRSIADPNQKEVEEYGKLLELINYYVPLTHHQLIQFVSFLPKLERKEFLRDLKLLDSDNVEKAGNLKPQQMVRLYNNFKAKYTDEEEVHLVQKRKGKRNTCKICNKKHGGKCFHASKKKESVNHLENTLDVDTSIFSDEETYLVLAEPNQEEINLIEHENEFLLDTGATIHVVNNKNWLTNMKKCEMSIRTINTKKRYDIIGEVKLNENLTLRNVVYIKDSPRNIISLSVLNKEGYDSFQEGCVCTIKRKNVTICKVPLKDKLYTLNTKDLLNTNEVYFVLGNDSKSTKTFKDYGEKEDKVLDEILGQGEYYKQYSTDEKEKPKWYCDHLKYGHASKNQLHTFGIKIKGNINDSCLDCTHSSMKS